ncbi:annexin A7-like isoform 1 [Cricetulus griseus]|uniref:Annexin A7-like isoform 1 n=1 Tax=Cricetulus griseus TaxID=10029 RepID=A0A061HUG7_CRIGR|nr:annexin A7-like isoform 1 [Cricetulus griseus]
MPSHYPGGQAPYPSQPASMTQGSQRTIRPASYFDAMRDAESLCKAMKSFGTDEQAIVDVVSSRSNDQRQQIKAALKTMYGKDLIKDLKSELSGNMEELILALSMPSTYYDAWSLRKAIQGAGTQERVLIEILCTRTNQEIQDTIKQMFTQMHRKTLSTMIASDRSGDYRKLLLAIVGQRLLGRREVQVPLIFHYVGPPEKYSKFCNGKSLAFQQAQSLLTNLSGASTSTNNWYPMLSVCMESERKLCHVPKVIALTPVLFLEDAINIPAERSHSCSCIPIKQLLLEFLL